MKRILVLGATSPIARHLAWEFARRQDCELVLAGRDAEGLELVAGDIRVRFGVPCRTEGFSAEDHAAHASFFARCCGREGLDGVILALGSLPDQDACERDPALARAAMETNLVAPIYLLLRAADHLERRGGGFICALSSVAGDRPRRANYVYGTAKNGLTFFLDGLRARLRGANVRVLTVKAGYVDTRMTFGLRSPIPVADPAAVAREIHRALLRGSDVVYVPAFWRPIMAVVRALPQGVLGRLKV